MSTFTVCMIVSLCPAQYDRRVARFCGKEETLGGKRGKLACRSKCEVRLDPATV